jgi:hypothetical protein
MTTSSNEDTTMRILPILILLALGACAASDLQKPGLPATAAEQVLACEDAPDGQVLECRVQRSCEVANALIAVKVEIPGQQKAADFGYASYMQQALKELQTGFDAGTFYPRAALDKYGSTLTALAINDVKGQISPTDFLTFNLTTGVQFALDALEKIGRAKAYLGDALDHVEGMKAGTLDPKEAFARCSANIDANVKRLAPQG